MTTSDLVLAFTVCLHKSWEKGKGILLPVATLPNAKALEKYMRSNWPGEEHWLPETEPDPRMQVNIKL